ncbi:MAG TPA: hypothetical protein VFO41_07585, partial [Alphaproteobacteria bacterium]|nr:hypothetical protein [Alphaproteobacteria bacterium]
QIFRRLVAGKQFVHDLGLDLRHGCESPLPRRMNSQKPSYTEDLTLSLGDVNPNADPHGASSRWVVLRPPARAVVALHSDDPQSLISGRGGVAVSGDLPPEPSRAASLKTIPTPPPRIECGMPHSMRQALHAQQLNGRAA